MHRKLEKAIITSKRASTANVQRGTARKKPYIYANLALHRLGAQGCRGLSYALSFSLSLMASVSSQPSGTLYLSLKLGASSYLDTFYSEILPKVRPGWKPDQVGRHVFESGVTNTLVAFYQKELGLINSGDDVILLRINGEGTEQIINRADEVVTITSLHKEGFCPPLLAQLENGLCYGFSPGRRLKVHETSSNCVIMRKVAGIMAKLHTLDIPDYFKEREPFLWYKIEDMMARVPTAFSNPDMQREFEDSIGSIAILEREIAAIKQLILTKCHSLVVFCHNDIHSANIIYNEETDKINLIDYEYAGPNYLAFDIANHFCEFAGVENVDYSLYPEESVQKMWIEMYLDEKEKLQNKGPVKAEDIDRLYSEVNKMVLGCHLMWVVWGLFQASHSTLDFNFIEYASLRFKEYMRRRDTFSVL